MAIGLDKNIIDEKMLFDVSRPLYISGYTINDFTPYDGKLDVKGIIVNSSNIGTAKIAKKIGKKNQIEFFKKIGFFDEIKFELKETQKPKKPKYWGKTETMTIGYGYGFAVTPLHLCQAYGTIANRGFMVNPTLLKKENINSYNERVVKLSTSDKINKLLRSVIMETKYTGPRVKIPGYDIGGKTGTAEINYGSGKNRTLFISLFPVANPKYLILAMVNDPKKIKETNYNNTGAWVAAPLVKRIMTEMIKILNIAPTIDVDLLNAKKQEIYLNKKNVII